MARPRLHQTGDALDAARDLVLDCGPRAAGIRAIARRTGAPTGSLYHRFGSRDGVVAQAWLRAVRRFQAGLLDALAAEDVHQAMTAGAAWTPVFALAEPADARLLLTHSASALLDGDMEPDVAQALRDVNEPIADAIRDLAVRIDAADTSARRVPSDHSATAERVTFAVVDLPYAVVRRQLLAGSLTSATAEALAGAAMALVPGGARC